MSDDTSVRILIANASPLVRLGLIAIIARQPSLSVVGEAEDGEEAVACCRQLHPDIVLMEVRLHCVNGIEATRLLRRYSPNTRVIMFALSDTEEDIHQAFRAGAKAYLCKDTTPDALLGTIRAVHAGEIVVPPEIAARLMARSQASPLSERELQVLRSLVAGNSNREIGEALCIAEGTVKVHIANILGKMQVTDRTQAVVSALRRGIVRLP
jgi:two-component system NarL family response regulator